MPSIPTTNLVEVSYDLAGAYIAWPVANTVDESALQRAIESMIASGELAEASYDIGERGGFASAAKLFVFLR